MAKMLMGQIDHARGRIKDLTREKLGESPSYPSLPDEDTFKEGIKDGTITVTPALLKNAITAWETQASRLEVERGGRSWRYQSQDYKTTPDKIITRNSGDLGDYLAYTFYQKKYEAALAVYEAELFEYNRRKALINNEATEVEDAIVLGDNAAALAALQKFAAFTV